MIKIIKQALKAIANFFFPILYFIGWPFTFIATGWLKHIRRKHKGLPIFMFWGILPVADHYYQPLINPKKHLKASGYVNAIALLTGGTTKQSFCALCIVHC